MQPKIQSKKEARSVPLTGCSNIYVLQFFHSLTIYPKELCNMGSGDNKKPKNRPERFISHALVEIKKFKSLPFFIESGILLDMSQSGFKVELTGSSSKIKNNTKYWLSMPLSPLGIRSPRTFLCQIEIKWKEDSSGRIGGVFIDQSEEAKHIIDQIMTKLRDAGNKI